jgi:hypothetical protein
MELAQKVEIRGKSSSSLGDFVQTVGADETLRSVVNDSGSRNRQS